MPDYEHSNNYHKIALKIKEISNLKDLESLKRKLGELEQDSEVRELISNCDERIKELGEAIKEDKYQKAVSEFKSLNAQLDLDSLSNESEAFNYKDFNALLAQFEEIKTYKDSAKYIDSLKKEREYISLINLYNSGYCNWEKVSERFKALGNYKKALEYYEACKPAVEEQRKERETQEKEKKYDAACKLQKEGLFQDAAVKFKALGEFNDSKQKAVECEKKHEEIEQSRTKKQLIIFLVPLLAFIIYLIIANCIWKADDSGHWHSVFGNQTNYSSHTLSDVNVVLEPSCTQSGIRTGTCSVCGALVTEPIPAFGHSKGDICEYCGEAQYAIGSKGPAGGYVFYDCDADNLSGNADGLISTECGWRFLEASPADLRYIYDTSKKHPTIDKNEDGYSGATKTFVFGAYHKRWDGPSLYVNGSEYYDEDSCTSTAVGYGESNSTKLIHAMGSKNAYQASYELGTSYPAMYCSNLVYSNFNDWFLPSVSELRLMYMNLKEKGIGGFASDYYWSSSEDKSNAMYALVFNFEDGQRYRATRILDYCRIRPIRAF